MNTVFILESVVFLRKNNRSAEQPQNRNQRRKEKIYNNYVAKCDGAIWHLLFLVTECNSLRWTCYSAGHHTDITGDP